MFDFGRGFAPDAMGSLQHSPRPQLYLAERKGEQKEKRKKGRKRKGTD